MESGNIGFIKKPPTAFRGFLGVLAMSSKLSGVLNCFENVLGVWNPAIPGEIIHLPPTPSAPLAYCFLLRNTQYVFLKVFTTFPNIPDYEVAAECIKPSSTRQKYVTDVLTTPSVSKEKSFKNVIDTPRQAICIHLQRTCK